MSEQRPPARQRVFVTVALIIGVLVVTFLSVAGIWTDKLWFDSVAFSSVFSKTLLTKALLFIVVGGFTAAMFMVNLVIAYRGRPAFLPSTPDVEALKDRKSTRLNSSHMSESRMPSSA